LYKDFITWVMQGLSSTELPSRRGKQATGDTGAEIPTVIWGTTEPPDSPLQYEPWVVPSVPSSLW